MAKFWRKLNKFGEEEFLKYLLETYPYKGYNNDNIIESYRNNKRTKLKKLKMKYQKYDDPSKNNNSDSKDILNKKIELIIKYLNNIEN